MKDDYNHNFDTIADLVQRQAVFLEILIHHLAAVEATVLVLALYRLPDETLRTVKEVENEILSKIHGRLVAEIERDLKES